MSQAWLDPVKNKAGTFKFASADERRLHAQVNQDVDDMDAFARSARVDARDAIQGYMALALTRPPDNRSRLFIPKIHAITYSRMSMEAANMPTVEYKARKQASKQQMKFLNAAKDNAEMGDGNLRPDSLQLWFHQNFDKILLGTGFRYLTYLLQTRIVKVRDEKGKIKEKRMTVHDDIWDEVPDFFSVGVSRDMKPGMFGGRACYYDKFYPRDHFVERFDNPFYQNVKKAAEQTDWFSGDTNFFWDVPQDWVRVRYYWDVFKDLFYVQGNGIPIRQDFIQDYGPEDRPKKFLPITSIHNDINYERPDPSLPLNNILQDGRQHVELTNSSTNRTFWTKGDAKLVQGLVGFSNSIWRAAHDHTKASSVHFLLAGSPGVYDQVRTADLYGVVPLKSATGESFDVKSLTEGSQYLSQFIGMDESIDNLMIFSLGNDWKRAASELTNEKATVAAIRQQVQRIRGAQNQKFNESGGIKRHYRVLLNLIQQYYPEKTIKEIGPDGVPEGTSEEDIVRDRDGHPVMIKLPKEVPIDEDIVQLPVGNGKFKIVGSSHPDAEGKASSRMFLASKETIVTEEEPEIYVEPGSSFAELKAIDRAQQLEYLNTVAPFLGMQFENQPLIPKEGVEFLLEETSKKFDMDPDKLFGRESEEKTEEISQKIPEPFSGLDLMTQASITEPMGGEEVPLPGPAAQQPISPGSIQGLAAELTP